MLKAGKVPCTHIIDLSDDDWVVDEPDTKRVKTELAPMKVEPAPATPPVARARSEESIPMTQDSRPGGSPRGQPASLSEVNSINVGTEMPECEIESKANLVSSILKSNQPFDVVLQQAPVDPVTPSVSDDVTDEEKMLAAALEHGKNGKAPFPARNCKLSRAWEKDLKSELGLAKKWAQTPRTHAAMAAVKLEWLKGKYGEVKRSRRSEDVSETSDACKGRYVNFAQL